MPGFKVTLDSYIVDANSELIREVDSSLTVVEDVDAALPVSGESLTGSFDSDVSVSENITVPADKKTTITGTLTVASDKAVTVEGTMTLNGGAELTGTIMIGNKGALAVNGTDTTNPVDAGKITGEAGAKVTFARNAALDPSSTITSYYWKDGTAVGDVNDLLGNTFTYRAASVDSGIQAGFYASVNEPQEPALEEAVLGTVNSVNRDYTVTRDTATKTVTVTTDTTEDDEVEVSIYAGVGQTIGFTTTEGVEKVGNTYTVTLGAKNSVSFTVTVSETGKTTTTWTIVVQRPDASTAGSR